MMRTRNPLPPSYHVKYEHFALTPSWLLENSKRMYPYMLCMSYICPGADPGFDRGGGGPDRDRPKTAILGPQFCRILVLGPHFWWSGGGARAPGPPPPGSAPDACLHQQLVWLQALSIRRVNGVYVLCMPYNIVATVTSFLCVGIPREFHYERL